jgi:DHA3 family macrolide efflux protein-like MFS transporter
MQKTNRPSGLFGFTVVWLGQIISVPGSHMTLFALTIWVFKETGSATALVGVTVILFPPSGMPRLCFPTMMPS